MFIQPPKLPEWPPLWTTTVEQDYATLTLLKGGGAILGLPGLVSEKQAKVARELIDEWLKDGACDTMSLPWPVKVDDQRVKP